jgi:hypothetical protein
MLYASTDWSIEIPDVWNVEQDDTCTTFVNPQGSGALQISSYRKDESVTDDDLREFAETTALSEVSIAAMIGLYAQFDESETSWRKWWLRSGNQMIFATYCCPLRERGREDGLVDSLLESLIAKYDGKNG